MTQPPEVDWLSQGDIEHQTRLAEAPTEDAARAMDVTLQAAGLIGSLLEWQPPRWNDTFPNEVAALACFTRAYRQLRATVPLCFLGYYSEVGLMLRGAYEAAGTGQYLAKDPERAERWLKKQEWFPEKAVRERLKALGITDESDGAYAAFYRLTSASSHPTARSCMPLLEDAGDGPRPRLHTQLDQEQFHECLWRLAATSVFVAWALRNSTPDERVIPPDWRQALTRLTQELANRHGDGHGYEHLRRDWEAENRQWDALADKVRAASEVDEELRRNSMSWRNLRPD